MGDSRPFATSTGCTSRLKGTNCWSTTRCPRSSPIAAVRYPPASSADRPDHLASTAAFVVAKDRFSAVETRSGRGLTAAPPARHPREPSCRIYWPPRAASRPSTSPGPTSLLLVGALVVAVLALVVGLRADEGRARRRHGRCRDAPHRRCHPRGCDGVHQAPVPHDRHDRDPAGRRGVPDVGQGHSGQRLASRSSFAQSGLFRTLAFLVGGAASASIGFLGMWLATRGNIRTTAAATP